MAVYPDATYRPLNEFSDAGRRPWLGVVLHVNDGDAPSLYDWIAGNNDMSCHWQVAKNGQVEQYVDTDNAAWCQMDGNADYLSIETQGFPTEQLTTSQVSAISRLLAWLNDTHGIPLRVADEPGQAGFGWHGMGGQAWGGHTGCPGELRKAQMQTVLDLAEAIEQPGPAEIGDDDMAFFAQDISTEKVYLVNATGLHLVNDEERLVTAACLGITSKVTVHKPTPQITILQDVLGRANQL